jgi:hypothetical protein
VILLRAWSGANPQGEVLAAPQPFRSELKAVNVDAVDAGYYFAEILRDRGLPVKNINVGETARDPAKFVNLKAEIFWSFRQRAISGDFAGLTDDRAIAQLAGIRYSYNSRGQVVIESKDDARRRGVKSPDRAEAIVLAYGHVPIAGEGIVEFYRLEVAKTNQNQRPI